MTKQEVIESIRGKNLDTPICIVRVFHIDNPDYTYLFVRQEDSEVLVVDDDNGQTDGSQELKFFSADELVNVAVFEEAFLRAAETPLPPPSPRK